MDLLAINSASHLLSASIISLVNLISVRYFSEYYSTCVIQTSTDNNFLINVPVPSVTITVDANFNETFLTAINGGCQAFIVYERALFPFLDAFLEIHDIADQRSENKKLLILMDSNDQQFMDRFTKHPNTVEIPNVLIVAPDSTNFSIALYTTKIFNNGSRSIKIVDIEPIYDPDYFPDKFSDMKGIPIHLYTLMYPPYTYYEQTVPEKSNARYHAAYKDDIPLFLDGTECSLLVELCRMYNCNIEVSFDEVSFWGDSYDNHTGRGLYGSVVERRSDIAFAALYYWLKPYMFATYSQPISRSGVTVLVPRPRILPPWRTPFLSFTLSLWIAVLVAFCVCVLAVWLIEKGRFEILQPDELRTTFSDAVLTMIGFYMEQSARMRTDLMSCTLLFTSLLFAGFMVGNCYSGGLAGVMTVPEYEKPIDTAYDLADSGMTWGSHVLEWSTEIHPSNEPHWKKLIETYRVITKETMRKHTKTHDMAFIGDRTDSHHFVPMDFVDDEASTMLQLLKEDLYWESIGALVTKTSPFIHKFNDLIMQVKQSGIQNFWELQASNRYLRATVQLNVLNARSAGSGDDVVKLTISHFLGAYMILATGLGMALLVFLVEKSRSFNISSIAHPRKRNAWNITKGRTWLKELRLYPKKVIIPRTRNEGFNSDLVGEDKL